MYPQVNALQYFTKVTTLIWQAVLKIWQIWNTHLHPGNPEQEECSQLQAAVNWVFYEVQQDPQLHALVEHITPEWIMNQPTWQICQWVTNSNNHVQAHWKVVQLQACLHTASWHMYILSPAQFPIIHRQEFVAPSITDIWTVWVLVTVPNGASDNTISNEVIFWCISCLNHDFVTAVKLLGY